MVIILTFTFNDLKKLGLKNGNKYRLIYIATMLQNISTRYSYGRQMRLKRLQNETLALPVDIQGNPDWQFMEDYIKSLPYSNNL